MTMYNNNNMYPGGGNNLFDLMRRFQQFRQSFQGDPRQQIQQMMNSGQITQEQYNRAVQMANLLSQFMR